MVKTRFAPSPTGNLHIGGARTALFNYLYARHHGGVFVLRVEDTDVERSRAEFVEDILGGLAWLGIDWDEGPYFQTQNMEAYRAHALKLLEQGLAYKCYCPAEVLEEKRKRAIEEGRKSVYDRTCRDAPPRAGDEPFVIRFKTPISGTVGFHDLIRGDISFQCEELDDLIILRSDGTPTYNFTVVIDDVLMAITHVIRGDDHINNTPRQVLIYQALGYPVPEFAHVPLIHGKGGGRLSKRHGATSVLEYRKSGFLPEALVNYLARLGWAHGDDEVFSKGDLVEKFDLGNVGKSAAVFDMDKLTWLNSHYIKTLPLEVIAERLVPLLEGIGIEAAGSPMLAPIVLNLRDRAKTLVEMAEMARFFFADEVQYEEKAREKYLTGETKPVLEFFLEGFRALTAVGEEGLRTLLESAAGNYQKKIVDIIQPVRVALSGKTVSPGIFEVITILGRERVEKRIQRAIESIP